MTAALEAAIEASPDDIEAYYVYGDWLQTRNDPRGELIALQAAQSRDPDDKKLAQRATKHLQAHSDVLIGALGNHGKKLRLVWRWGFLRGAELELDRAALPGVLRALVRHPSSRFLTWLRFAGKQVEVDTVVNVLLEEKRPTTLGELAISGLTDEARDKLAAVFPRLGRAQQSEWRTILAAVEQQRKLDVKYDASKLPALEARPGVDVDVEPEQILRALRLELDRNKPVEAVAAMRRSFTAESLDRFAVAVGKQFEKSDEQAAMKWGFLAMGKLGGATTARWLGDRLGNWSHQRAMQAVGLLAEIGTPEALFEIYAMVSDRRHNQPRRDDATRVLDGIAHQRKLGVEEMLDRSVPVALTPRLRETETRRLLAQMIDGRRMDHRDFLRHVVTHPGVGPLAERLIWASYDGGDVELTFRSTGEQVVDLEGNTVDLEGASIGIVHPAELSPATRAELAAGWREAFEALGIEPLFPQLERRVFEPRPNDDGVKLTRFKLRFVGFDELRNAFAMLDWVGVRDDDEHWGTTEFERWFRRDSVRATAHIIDGAIGVVTFASGGKQVSFGKLHRVTKSEILLDLETATAKPDQAPSEIQTASTPLEPIEKGARVRILRGQGAGQSGVVFWTGDGNRGPRCGIRGDDGETYWSDVAALELTDETKPAAAPKAAKAAAKKPAKRPIVDDDDEDAPAPAPAGLAKGTQVNWRKGKHTGTGVVFWVGKNKFGDGMRAGIKDDETGETVWADTSDCQPAKRD